MGEMSVLLNVFWGDVRGALNCSGKILRELIFHGEMSGVSVGIAMYRPLQLWFGLSMINTESQIETDSFWPAALVQSAEL